jgi:tRNA modification GTPase
LDVQKNTTIAALSTPPGYAGIAIIRLSGTQALSIAEKLTQDPLPPRTANFRTLYEDDNATQIIDTAIIIFFPAPHSFTGEDTVELQTHGNPLIVEKCLKRLYQLGASIAQPGEFSERAFLNNKIDLTQAEAIMDLIHASSEQSLKIAQQSLQGTFSIKINQLAEKMLKLRANIELSLDFPDEEIDFIDKSAITQELNSLIEKIQHLTATATQGKTLTEGINIVIIGEPNVGKSTLLNCLLGEQRAIISPTAGTTRDLLNEKMLLDGLTLNITDTAGLRESQDEIEQEGIRRAKQAIKTADLILFMTTAESPQDYTENQTTPQITIINKCDLENLPPQDLSTEQNHCIRISAEQQLGIDLLKQKIKQIVQYQPHQAKFSARGRSVEFLTQSQNHLNEALPTLQQQPELSAESIKLAHQSLQNITGKIITDDILEVIFREFCIGK